MNRIIIISILILSNLSSTYSQDCCDKLSEQAVIIDSLRKIIKNNDMLAIKAQTNQKALSDTIKSLNSDLQNLEKFKSQKKHFDKILKTKFDSIAILKNQLSEKDEKIAIIEQKSAQNSREENERGKEEALANIVKTYQNNFDILIKFSTKEAIQRDIQLIGSNKETKQVLNDLQTYFSTKELLTQKFNEEQIKNALYKLNNIKQNSNMLSDLKANIAKYHFFNNGMKETVNYLIELDKNEPVNKMDEQIQTKKLQKIVAVMSVYFFDYNFNFVDFPYLSDIVIEILKRKRSNVDADLTDLVKKLE